MPNWASCCPSGSDQFDRPAVVNFCGTEDKSMFQVRNTHRLASLRVAMPDRFRVDFGLDERTRWPRTIACDGERLRKVYHNRVIASPARTLTTDFVRLIEPAWLLADWQLTEGGEEIFAGRTAMAVQAVPPPTPPRLGRDDSGRPKSLRIVVLIDSDLGIILRQVSYADDQPVAWIELRELAALPEADPAEFGSAIAPGLPVISTDGEPLDDLDLPPVANSIRQVSSELLSGAQAAFGWLARQLRT